MKRISRSIFWLVFAKLAVCLVYGEFFILSGPEFRSGLNFYYTYHQQKDMFCITNEVNSALTWNDNLKWMDGSSFVHSNQIQSTYLLYNDIYVYPDNDNLTCQMNQTSSCSNNWNRTGSWTYVTSLTNPMSPVTDNRWEDLKVEEMSDHFKIINTLPTSGSLAVSIRGFTDAHFALCKEYSINSVCYFIILGGWENKKSVIMKCMNGIPDPVSNFPTNNCENEVDTFNATVLSSTEWRTFLIKWNFDTAGTDLSIYDSNSRILNYVRRTYIARHYFEETTKSDQLYHLFARSKDKMLMKFHIYGYSLTTTTQSKLISPEIMTTSSDRRLCIEMSISICEKCSMTVDFMGRNDQLNSSAATFSKFSNPDHLPVWQSVKLNRTLPAGMQQPIRLLINTFLTNSTYRPFWAISNVRRCYDGALKVARMRASQDYSSKTYYFWQNVTCQKISTDGTSRIIDSTSKRATTLNAEKKQICAEGNIGTSCSVNCSKLFNDNKYCQKLLACDENGCSCGQGFTMPTCDNVCPKLTYGFECKQKCGNCSHNTCSHLTGKCIYGCENTDNHYFKPPECKIGIGSPLAPDVETISSTCARIFLDVKQEFTIIPTSVNFEIWTNRTRPLFVSERMNVERHSENIEIIAEHLSPGTYYNVIAVIYAANRTFRGKWGGFTTPCTEFVAQNFEITSNETSITVNTQHVHVNDSCPYTWYRVQLYSTEGKLFDDSYIFPKVFSGLEPFSEYTTVIATKNTTILVKKVSTLEGAPDMVRDLEAVDTATDKFAAIWIPPDKARGKIVYYTLEIEAIESIGCSSLHKPSYSLSNYSAGAKFHRRTVIENSLQSSFKYTFSALKPYTKYLVTIYASTSRHEGEIKELYHETAPREIPSEVFSNLRLISKSTKKIAAYLAWGPPTDCSAITGTLQAAKLFIRKFGTTKFTAKKTVINYLELQKSEFDGTETYEVHLHPLRAFNSPENKTSYTNLKFTMPAREPPLVRNAEIVEVDLHSDAFTLRWKPPPPPMHGTLGHYSINFCNKKLATCRIVLNHTIVHINEFCKLWDLKNIICKTHPFPSGDYDIIQIKAHNLNVTEGSEAITLSLLKDEFEPDAPSELIATIASNENSAVRVSWNHPLKSGGRLQKFIIESRILNSSLKKKLWTEKQDFFEIGNASYQPHYSTQLDLLPSTNFTIVVRAVTIRGIPGKTIKYKIELPNFINFSSEDLHAETNDELIINIKIPEVLNDVEGSIMILVVQGPKYCDEGPSNNEDVHWLLDTQSSSYYRIAWKAATLTKPELYANKQFQIGNGQVYGNSKNYALCPKESYIVHLVLINDPKSLSDKQLGNVGKNILKSIKTNSINVGELPKNYATWLTLLFFIILVAMVLIMFIYRRKLASRFLINQSKAQQQENMPLSNDLSKNNNSIDEVETAIKIKDTKDVPNNNIMIVDKKKEFLMPVKVEDFGNYFEQAYKSGALVKQYSSITHGLTRPYTYGSQPETKPKNRYANLFPYDDTRVILEKLPDDPYSDYINANFITGYGEKEKAYIATQGPKPNTVVDFWRMIWQEKVQIICMMANLAENGKIKCEQYWPSAVGKKVLYGTISVQFSSEEIHSDYTYRKFRVHCGKQEAQTIEHLHYTAWPDHGVPSNPQSIVAFLKEIQKHAPIPRKLDERPIVVHCSAGVGRTGTLIVLDMSLCRAFSENVIDVYADTLSVRKERLNMVDNTEQYLLLHLVLVECLNSQNICFLCDKTLPEKIMEAKKNAALHYQRILDTSWWNEVLGSPPLPEKSLSNRNREKHRFPESAGGLNRLCLKRSVFTDEDSDYIAATLVKGIFKNYQYITTQLPMPSTAADFWRMLSEQNVELVLVLQLPDLQNPTYCEVVPENQEFGNTKYLKIIRQENLMTNSQYYSKDEVLIIDSSEQPSKEQIVKIISYKNWPESSLPPANEIVKLWKTFEEIPKTEKYPLVIACRNGVTASGLWLALSFLLKRMSVDKECDVFQAVRVIQRYRKDFLNKAEYLKYLYDVALAWANES